MRLLLIILFLYGCFSDDSFRPDYGLKKIVVEEPREGFKSLFSHASSKRRSQVFITIDSQRYYAVIRSAGAGTLRSSRQSYDIIFENPSNYDGMKRIRLAAQSGDPSQMRGYLAYQLFESMGLMVPRYEPVALYFGAKYMGFYSLIETISPQYFNAKDLPLAVLYKSPGRSGDTHFDINMGSFVQKKIRCLTRPRDYSHIHEWLRILHNKPIDAFQDAISRKIDIDLVLRYLATSFVLNHYDGFIRNFFFYSLTDNPYYFYIHPWDMDATWESNRNALESMYGNALFKRVLKIPGNQNLTSQYIDELITGAASFSELSSKASEYRKKITAAYSSDRVLSSSYRLSEEKSQLISIIDTWYNGRLLEIRDRLAHEELF